jgi:hypothetical protein
MPHLPYQAYRASALSSANTIADVDLRSRPRQKCGSCVTAVITVDVQLRGACCTVVVTIKVADEACGSRAGVAHRGAGPGRHCSRVLSSPIKVKVSDSTPAQVYEASAALCARWFPSHLGCWTARKPDAVFLGARQVCTSAQGGGPDSLSRSWSRCARGARCLQLPGAPLAPDDTLRGLAASAASASALCRREMVSHLSPRLH